MRVGGLCRTRALNSIQDSSRLRWGLAARDAASAAGRGLRAIDGNAVMGSLPIECYGAIVILGEPQLRPSGGDALDLRSASPSWRARSRRRRRAPPQAVPTPTTRLRSPLHGIEAQLDDRLAAPGGAGRRWRSWAMTWSGSMRTPRATRARRRGRQRPGSSERFAGLSSTRRDATGLGPTARSAWSRPLSPEPRADARGTAPRSGPCQMAVGEPDDAPARRQTPRAAGSASKQSSNIRGLATDSFTSISAARRREELSPTVTTGRGGARRLPGRRRRASRCPSWDR